MVENSMPADLGLVSVIMPAWNAEETIADSIQSALGQSYTNIRLIIIDDCSTDDTVDVVKAFSRRDDRVQLIQLETNQRAAMARNHGILERPSESRWLAFLDSDDVWHPDKIRLQLEHASSANSGLVYSSYWRMSSDMSLYGRPVRVPKAISYQQLLSNTAIAASTVLMDLEKIPKVQLVKGMYEDFELWTRLLSSGVVATGVQQPLMCYRLRKDSVSSKSVRMSRHTWRIIKGQPNLSFARACSCYFRYAVRAFFKHARCAPKFPLGTHPDSDPALFLGSLLRSNPSGPGVDRGPLAQGEESQVAVGSTHE